MSAKFILTYLAIFFIVLGIFNFKTSLVFSSGTIINMVPQNPAPNENTTITLNSYADNLDTANISWSVDGKNISSGVGKKTFSVNAPNLGVEMNVVATISLPNGTTTETKILIKPSIMVLLWQTTNTYVPPFYKGKALPPEGGDIKIVAMPEIKNTSGYISPDNLVYYWKKDYTNDQQASGYAKNSYTYSNNYLDDTNNISVTTSTLDQTYSTNGSVDVGKFQPKILLYKESDTGTMWENTISDTHKIQAPEIIKAVPYFIFPKNIQSPALVWNWYINDNQVNLKGLQKNLMPLQIKEGTHGTSTLKLSIENRESLFGPYEKTVNIEF